MDEQKKIRNFCIIAHIDHGKSTLSDRMLEITGAVEKRNMKEQILDSMDLEREKGITIKLAPARMNFKGYELNLIDTPGHVDFNYEVSRSLAAVEGAVLMVDATQGVQAQTIGNLYLALDENLTIIPVLNKIDLPAADIEARTKEIVQLLGCDASEILSVSAKTGKGVEKVLDTIIEKIPSPKGVSSDCARALVFDSHYDDYKGVVAYVRVVDGSFKKKDNVRFMATKAQGEILEIGFISPSGMTPTGSLQTGQIGYLVSGQKELETCRVGDTVTIENSPSQKSLKGYKEVKPMVFAGVFPEEGSDFARLRDAIERLKLNDASLTFEPEHSPALGYGFRCGLLGMLHLEILKERLQREFNIDLVVTVPSVAYIIRQKGKESMVVKSPLDLPDPAHIDQIEEPWVKADIVTPNNYIGAVMQLVQDRRGVYLTTEYLSENRAILHYEIPLAMVIVDFYDKLKGVTAGYASLNYEFFTYRAADVVRMDIYVAEDQVEAFSSLIYRDEAERVGRKIVKTLKESIPKQMFVIKLQASVGAKIVAAERISAMRKDVTAKLYGGDVTRKRKLLEKQKKGKAKMADIGKGKVKIPTDAYLSVLKR
ncbi:MAG: translation elongation factor 4 [Patescibacteria group bacterium]